MDRHPVAERRPRRRLGQPFPVVEEQPQGVVLRLARFLVEAVSLSVLQLLLSFVSQLELW